MADDQQATVESPANESIFDSVKRFFTSQYTIKQRESRVQQVEQAMAFDVGQKLEDNLKLTRWAVLERDAFQYRKLMRQNVDWFKQYYDLEQAANTDFYESLLKLQQSQIKPDLPDISGSLRLLRQIENQRENAPAAPTAEEVDNG